ncbi:hypothetical protein MKW98_013926, partial [Papaver atlanticum]
LDTSVQPYCWNQIVTLRTKYQDITKLSQLALAVELRSTSLKATKGSPGLIEES